MLKVIEIDVEELWRRAHDGVLHTLGDLHLETAHKLLENPKTPLTKLSLYPFMMSEKYHALRGKSRRHNHCVAYLNTYKKVLDSIKRMGYSSEIGTIKVRTTPDGKFDLRDGRRRLASIIVIGSQKKVRVEVV